jgi:hypothetical protein
LILGLPKQHYRRPIRPRGTRLLIDVDELIDPSTGRFTYLLQSRYKTSLPRRRKHAPFRRETSRECHKVCIPIPLLSPPRQPGLNAASLGAPPTPHSRLLCKVASPNPTAAARVKRSSTPYLQPKTSLHAATTLSRLCLKRSPSLPLLGRCPASSLPR